MLIDKEDPSEVAPEVLVLHIWLIEQIKRRFMLDCYGVRAFNFYFKKLLAYIFLCGMVFLFSVIGRCFPTIFADALNSTAALTDESGNVVLKRANGEQVTSGSIHDGTL